MTSCARRKREERLRKVLQARERVEQMKEEKKKQIEQKFAQIDEKTEKVLARAVGSGCGRCFEGAEPRRPRPPHFPREIPA